MKERTSNYILVWKFIFYPDLLWIKKFMNENSVNLSLHPQNFYHKKSDKDKIIIEKFIYFKISNLEDKLEVYKAK